MGNLKDKRTSRDMGGLLFPPIRQHGHARPSSIRRISDPIQEFGSLGPYQPFGLHPNSSGQQSWQGNLIASSDSTTKGVMIHQGGIELGAGTDAVTHLNFNTDLDPSNRKMGMYYNSTKDAVIMYLVDGVDLRIRASSGYIGPDITGIDLANATIPFDQTFSDQWVGQSLNFDEDESASGAGADVVNITTATTIYRDDTADLIYHVPNGSLHTFEVDAASPIMSIAETQITMNVNLSIEDTGAGGYYNHHLKGTNTQNVTTSSVKIFDGGTLADGAVALVQCRKTTSGNDRSLDLVLFGRQSTPSGLAHTLTGSPAARTYAGTTSDDLYLQMAADTYDVTVIILGAMESPA